MKLTTAQKNRLPGSAFAIPEWRWGPLVDARHVHNAASRLEHEHNVGSITGARYIEAKRRIAGAARRFRTDSKYLHENPWTPETRTVVQVAALALIAAVVFRGVMSL